MKRQIILFFLAISLLLSGCNMNEQKQEKREVSILYSSIADFQRDFGFIESKFKNLSIKIIEFTPDLGQGIWNEMRFTPSQGGDWDSKSYINLVKQYQPDILFFPQSIYSDLLSESMLSDLSTYINEKDLDGITPNFIDTLKDMGNGRLYALSDSISSQVLFIIKYAC